MLKSFRRLRNTRRLFRRGYKVRKLMFSSCAIHVLLTAIL